MFAVQKYLNTTVLKGTLTVLFPACAQSESKNDLKSPAQIETRSCRPQTGKTCNPLLVSTCMAQRGAIPP